MLFFPPNQLKKPTRLDTSTRNSLNLLEHEPVVHALLVNFSFVLESRHLGGKPAVEKELDHGARVDRVLDRVDDTANDTGHCVEESGFELLQVFEELEVVSAEAVNRFTITRQESVQSTA